LQTVAVTSFDVEVKVADSLLLSLDGDTWSDSVAITESTLEDVSYEDHTNSWGEDGLIPMSSIGEMDETSSRMKLYEKASLTNTPGGFRLIASQVDNSILEDEKSGYVVFDLFVKNFSGTQYLEALNTATEEAIYLTTDSAVTVSAAGTAGTGIENSVRVGFAQIGRVAGTTDVAGTITAIDCTGGGDVTGICRTAQIWEPNDKAHEANAISWYDTICVARTGADITLPASYSGECGTVANGTYVPTYAINDEIEASDSVDVYDGAEYNTYESTTLLTAVDTYTDTMKNVAGVSRELFMTLQPNSITKVRVYIWIEGQEVDNYDYAELGQAISVNFEFTKQKLKEKDFEYFSL